MVRQGFHAERFDADPAYRASWANPARISRERRPWWTGA